VCSLSLILIGHEFESVRGIIRKIVVVISSENIANSINLIYTTFFSDVFKICIYLGIVIIVINYLIKVIEKSMAFFL